MKLTHLDYKTYLEPGELQFIDFFLKQRSLRAKELVEAKTFVQICLNLDDQATLEQLVAIAHLGLLEPLWLTLQDNRKQDIAEQVGKLNFNTYASPNNYQSIVRGLNNILGHLDSTFNNKDLTFFTNIFKLCGIDMATLVDITEEVAAKLET